MSNDDYTVDLSLLKFFNIISNSSHSCGLRMATCGNFSDSGWDLNPLRDVLLLFSLMSGSTRPDIAASPPRRGEGGGFGCSHLVREED